MYSLGVPLPDSPHAVSVSLPKWADVVGYEEGEKRVIDAMQLGYPRFVYHPLVKKLFADCEEKFASADEFCQTYPSQQTAIWCVEYCGAGKVVEFTQGIWAAILPKGLEKKAKEFWQHAGFVVSSRLAESRQQSAVKSQQKDFVKEKLAQLSGADVEDIYLFPSGMAAIFMAYKITTQPLNHSTIQLGFPYVDTLKIQQKWGSTEFVQFNDFEKLAKTDADAVFTEYPLNPLLQLVDFSKVRAAIGTTPLIVDDTLCAWQGFNALDVADIAVTSLTKFFSGIGDVMAGSLILNKKSPHYAKFKAALDELYEDLLHGEDAEVLAENCQNFEVRMAKILDNAEKLTVYLKTATQPLNHSSIRHHGGMISVILPSKDAAVKFYDALQVKKGPSLGTEYTLACPYTLLAHYTELDWAESVGVSAHLVRISVGCEDYDSLQEVFAKALKSV